jgi:phenylpropionate dioxygenase-like ring-hydroxylating dioxygenase large terminal subunit
LTWRTLLRADELPPAGVRAVVVAGREVVAWRTDRGEPAVCDARCPHQWSHLEAEGVVDGEELVCTAHFWRFSTDGTGSKLSVKGRRDPKADLASFPCREVDGMLEADLPDG